jgi:hypothetical protein
MECLVCRENGAEVGSLCRRCAQQVKPCEGLIPEHIHSTVSPVDADAWLVDGFGIAHGVAEKTMVGRSHKEGIQLSVLAESVSREHGELRSSKDGWELRDTSHNGTFVDGSRCKGKMPLPSRGIVKFGDVAMWFLTEVVDAPASPTTMPTVDLGTVHYRIVFKSVVLELVGNADNTKGGALRARAEGASAWTRRDLPTLEYQLLRTLCVRAVTEAGSPDEVRGCVPTTLLATELPFQSRYANDENVRQVVRRLRGQLDELGAKGLLDVRPGRGYYLAAPVTMFMETR